MGKRVSGRRIVVAVAALAAAVAIGSPVRPAAADPALDVPNTTVAVGQPLVFTASDCPRPTDPGVEQYVEGGIVVGTGADAVRAGIVDNAGTTEDELQAIPMGWVDPDQPAVLSVACVRRPINGPATLVHDYPEVSIDIVAPASPVPTLDAVFDRTTAAGGQALRVTGSGCPDEAIFELYAGADLSFRTTLATNRAAIQEMAVAPDGTFEGLIPLNDLGGPLVEGPYVISTFCDLVPEDRGLARPVLITVDGTNPSDQIDLSFEGRGTAVLDGEGCPDDQIVTATWSGQIDDGIEGGDEVTGSASVRPDVGSWQLPLGDDLWEWIRVTTDCGDPTTTGFRYLDQEAAREPAGPTTTASTTVAPDPGPDTAPAAAPIPATATYTG